MTRGEHILIMNPSLSKQAEDDSVGSVNCAVRICKVVLVTTVFITIAAFLVFVPLTSGSDAPIALGRTLSPSQARHEGGRTGGQLQLQEEHGDHQGLMMTNLGPIISGWMIASILLSILSFLLLGLAYNIVLGEFVKKWRKRAGYEEIIV